MQDFPYIPFSEDFNPLQVFLAIAIARGIGRVLEEDEELAKGFLLRVESRIESNKLGTEDIDFFEQLDEIYSPSKFATLKAFREKAGGELGLFRGIAGYWRSEERQFWNPFLSEYLVYYQEEGVRTVFSIFLSLKDRYPLKKLVDTLSEFFSFLLEKRTDSLSALTVSEVSKEFLDFLLSAADIEATLRDLFLLELYRGNLEISEISTYTAYRWEEVFFQEYPVDLIVLDEKTPYDRLKALVYQTKQGQEKKNSKEKKEEKGKILVFPGSKLPGYVVRTLFFLFDEFQYMRVLTKREIKKYAKLKNEVKTGRSKIYSGRIFASNLFLKEGEKIFVVGLQLEEKLFFVLKDLLKRLLKRNTLSRYEQMLSLSLRNENGSSREQEKYVAGKLPPAGKKETFEAHKARG